jgi:hypothetical protein
LEQVFQGERLGERKLEVKRLTADEAVDGCHLVFLGDMDEARMRRLLVRLKGKPVLTASARPRFCDTGGMVGFEVERGKVVFTIHREAVREAGVTIHSRLLNMARRTAPTEAR